MQQRTQAAAADQRPASKCRRCPQRNWAYRGPPVLEDVNNGEDNGEVAEEQDGEAAGEGEAVGEGVGEGEDVGEGEGEDEDEDEGEGEAD